jgi:hypothetical protein
MQISTSNVFFSIMLTGGLSGSLFAGIHDLNFRGISGQNEQALCESRMVEIATKFTAATSIKVLGTRCERVSSVDNFRGTLSYMSVTPVKMWSSESGHSDRDREYFRSKESCERGLVAEIQVMKSLTGLTPFASYCAETNIVGPKAFRTRIDAIGESSVVKIEDHISFQRELVDSSSLTDGLCRLASARGLRVIQWSQMERLGASMLAVGYYDDLRDEQKNELAQRGLFFYANESECDAQLKALSQRWKHNVLPAVFACSKSGYNGSQLNAAWWGGEFAEYELDAQILPQSFDNLSLCQTEGRRIEGVLTAEGAKVLGSLCGSTGDQPGDIRLEIYTR